MGNGYRDYAPETLGRLNFIRRSRTARFTLAWIREVFHIPDAGVAPCQHGQDLLEARLRDLGRQIADLQALRCSTPSPTSATPPPRSTPPVATPRPSAATCDPHGPNTVWRSAQPMVAGDAAAAPTAR